MKYTNKDLVHVQNLIKIITRGSYTFTGLESMAFTEACRWLNCLLEEIQKEVNKPDMAAVSIKPAVVQSDLGKASKPSKTKGKRRG